LLDYFIKKPLTNTPEPQAENSLDDIKRLLHDTRYGFKKIEQTFYKGVNMVSHETKIFPDYQTIANELGFDLKNTRSGVGNCISGYSNSYKGYKWSKITRETYFKEE
tara:strand:- start:449 stop:769 length:321 start_codon:yes stop_codon:yes gene_type:complete